MEQYKIYEYNAFNQTSKVIVEDYHENSKESHVQKNFYDAENMRYGIEEDGVRTSFVTNGWNVFTELDAEWKPTKRLVRGYGIVASEESFDSGAHHYYHQNEHGDIEYITGMDGKVQNSYTYDAFGNITDSVELVKNRYTYNGEQFDQISQQYYLRARYYNPLVGRFTQEDVYRRDGLNLYAYCGNNPVMYVDSSGYAKADNNINIDIPDNTEFRDNYDILGKTHTETNVTGTVYSKGTVNSIDRTVYQMNDIDWDYVSKSLFNKNGLSNRELARKGNTPFGSDDMYIELHHLIQKEPGAMIELMGSKHKKYYKALHGIVENGGSFRNNPQLEAQYNKFRKEYWKERIKQAEKMIISARKDEERWKLVMRLKK